MRKLETRLGVRLLNRTTRSVLPTEAGHALAEHLEAGFGIIGAAIDRLYAYRTSPVGRLRINVPRDASRLLIGPVLPAFCEAYPDIHLDITVDDRLVDIIADGYDAGIRYGDTVARDMIAVPLTPPLRWVVVGSPAYLARRGRPAKPEDLMRHACIRMRIGDNSLYRWELGNGRRTVELDVPGTVIANETETEVEAALNGVGLAYCLERRVAADIAAGRLEVVLPKWSVTGVPMVMYYPSRRQTLPGLRQLIEMIRAANGAAGTARTPDINKR